MANEKTGDFTPDMEFRAITEQGDLGLGADVLNADDQKIIAENMAIEE